MNKKLAKRRANILYRLRKKGVSCSTKERIISFPYSGKPFEIIQIKRLCDEFHFHVQLIIE